MQHVRVWLTAVSLIQLLLGLMCRWDCCFSLPPLPSLAQVDVESFSSECKTPEVDDSYKAQCDWCLPSLSQVFLLCLHHC